MEELISVRTEILTKSSELEGAWSKQYGGLARVFADMLGKKVSVTAEIGCGDGALTIPLAKQASGLQFVLVDRFADTVHGSYSRNYRALRSNLKKTKLMKRVRVVISDYLKWIKTQDDETYDAVISCEFLPEIGSAETKQFIHECYRLLKPRGVSVHSFLSPVPRNIRQKLLITADSNPMWTNTPPKKWFSPKPDLVIKQLRKSGLQRIRRVTIRSHLIMKADAAKSWLKGGEIKENFFEAHRRLLNTRGLEVPDWIIVSGVKP
jgi:cyclopropane fatty-acyl-phospholipid synthase-like methyltransferase